jgi:hypothetical protein
MKFATTVVKAGPSDLVKKQTDAARIGVDNCHRTRYRKYLLRRVIFIAFYSFSYCFCSFHHIA